MVNMALLELKIEVSDDMSAAIITATISPWIDSSLFKIFKMQFY